MDRGGLVFSVMFLAVIAWMLFLICGALTDRTECVEQKVVISVGGCNRDACGVMFHDGSYGDVAHPVIGRKACTRMKSTNIWGEWKQ